MTRTVAQLLESTSESLAPVREGGRRLRAAVAYVEDLVPRAWRATKRAEEEGDGGAAEREYGRRCGELFRAPVALAEMLGGGGADPEEVRASEALFAELSAGLKLLDQQSQAVEKTCGEFAELYRRALSLCIRRGHAR